MALCDLHGEELLKESLLKECGKKVLGQMSDHAKAAGQAFLM